jgi:hypothetical protein
MYVRMQKRRRGGLRGITYTPGGIVPFTWTPSVPDSPAPVSDLSTTDLLSNWLTSGFGVSAGCYPWDINCANKVPRIQQGQAQIQDSVNRAKAAGYPQSVVDAMQQAADYQKAQVGLDVGSIDASLVPPGPLNIPTWMWLAAGAAALWAVTR